MLTYKELQDLKRTHNNTNVEMKTIVDEWFGVDKYTDDYAYILKVTVANTENNGFKPKFGYIRYESGKIENGKEVLRFRKNFPFKANAKNESFEKAFDINQIDNIFSDYIEELVGMEGYEEMKFLHQF